MWTDVLGEQDSLPFGRNFYISTKNPSRVNGNKIDLYTYVCVDKWREEQSYIELTTYQNENRLQNDSLRGE